MSILLLLIIVLILKLVSSQLTSSVLSSNDITNYINQAKLHLKNININTLNDADDAVSLLSSSSLLLNNNNKIQCDCNNINNFFNHLSNNDNDYKVIKSTVTVSKYCGCNVSINNDVKTLLNNALKSDSLYNFCYSALAAKAISDKDVSISVETLVNRLKSFSFATLDSVTLVLEVLAAYVTEESKSSMASIADSTTKFLPKGTDIPDDNEVDSSLLAYIAAVTVKKNGLAASRLLAIGKSLLDLKASHNLKVVSRALSSMEVVATYKTQPLHISFAKNSFTTGGKDKTIKVTVKDIAGKSIVPKEIEVQSINMVGKSKNYFEGLAKEDTIDIPAEILTQPGLYHVNIAVKIEGRQKAVSAKLPFVISTALTITDVQIAVTETKTVKASDFTSIKTENFLSMDSMSASSSTSDIIHVGFKVSVDHAMKAPHQAFVKYTHVETGVSSYFIGSESKISDSEYKYKSVVTLTDEIETFLRKSGLYTVSILVGDTSGKAKEWILGSITLSFPAKEIKILPLYTKSLLHTSDNTLAALPDIVHQNRPASKRASFFTASIFTALSTLPLIVLLGFFLSLKCELSLLKAPSTLLFMCCLIGTVLLYSSYWLALPGFSFYQTIYYICFLAPVTFIIGKYALKDVQERRTKLSEKDKDN